MTEWIGKRIDNYQIDALLGEGGMGSVYRARDVNLNRAVAVKVMHSQFARREQFQKRFMQEAQAAARLDKPTIVKIFNFGHRDDLLYMVMEYVSGGSLSTYLRKIQRESKVIKLDEVLYLLADVADALGYAHSKGVIHRDVKPDNILLKRLEEPDREGQPPLRPVVTDFGLAKLMDGDLRTATDTFMGTLPYMSPEQVLGEALDGRSDLYSLGVILYQLATGKLPLQINSPTDAVRQHMTKTPAPPRTVRPDLPGPVADLITKAVARKPEDRFQSGPQMAQALRQVAQTLTPDDVTQFAPAHTVMSLVTELQSASEPALPTQMEARQPLQGSGDVLVIARKGAAPQQLPLRQAQMTIGRDESNDLTLAETGVSRRHARLERTSSGWQIVDLGSTNGTYVDGNKLLPDMPEPLQEGQTVRIATAFIHWRSASGTEGRAAGTSPGATLSPGATRIQSLSGKLSVVLDPTHVSLQAGREAALKVEMFNEASRVAHYQLGVEGLPPSWFTAPKEPVQLMPGDSIMLPVRLHPPRSSTTRAGRHRFQVHMKSDGVPVATVSGALVVEPFSHYAVDIQPSHLANGGTTQVKIDNQGNEAATYELTGRDPTGQLRFNGQRQLTVEPGERGMIPVQVGAPSRPWVGTAQTLPFELLVAGPEDQVQTRAGQLRVTPRLPLWLIPVTALLFTFLCAGALFAFSQINQRNAEGTRQAESTIVALAALTREADQAAQAAAEATSLAATAIVLGDDDGDGLSNQQEMELGTLIDNPDSDGDGLNDGEEQNQHKTQPLVADSDGDGLDDGQEVITYFTIPNNPDTDNDGLNDGDEIGLLSDPKNRDTDGDGQADGQDPDPLAPPTGVPTVTASPPPPPTGTTTPTPTGTSSPTATPTQPILIVTVDLVLAPYPGEDCISLDYQAAEIQSNGGNWLLVANNSSHLSFGTNQAEAQTALAIVQFYQMNKQCFVGRPQPSLHYFLVDNQPPEESFPGEDCIGFDPGDLEIRQVGEDARIVAGNSILLNFDDNLAEAQQSLDILQYYDFEQYCFVGRPDPSMEYFRR